MKNKKRDGSPSDFLYYFFCFVLLPLALVFLGTAYSYALTDKSTSYLDYLTSSARSLLPSPTPTVAPVPTEYVYPTITITQVKQNADPLVNCSIHINCGGGTRLLKQSVCNQSTCCGFSNGSWLFYESKAKCTQDQTLYNNKNNSKYVYPTYARSPTWIPLATWAPFPTSAPLPTYSNTVYVPQKTKSQCESEVNDKYRSQMMSYGCAYPCPDSGDCGSTGTCDFLWGKAQNEMASCNQYP